MADDSSHLSRRTVFQGTGGAFAATAPAIGAAAGSGGRAAAAPDSQVEVNVGFSPGGDLGAAKSAADSIVRELANLDVVDHLAAQGHSRSTIVSRLLSTARGVGLPPEEQGAGLLDAKAAAK